MSMAANGGPGVTPMRIISSGGTGEPSRVETANTTRKRKRRKRKKKKKR